MAERQHQTPGLATLAVRGGGPESGIEALEQRVAALEQGTAAVAVAAGAGLIVTLLRPLMRPGEQAIVARELAAGTRRLLVDALSAFGWEMRWAELDEPSSFERAIGPKTQAILVPALAGSGHVADLDAIARLAKRAGVPLIVDNTLPTPALCRPTAFGADIVIHADTRFLSGQTAGVGFIVDGGSFNWLAAGGRYPVLTDKRASQDGLALAESVGNFAYAAACREFAGGGAALDVATVAAGVETLPLRMAKHVANAVAVAEYLAGHERVVSVAYPGLPGDRHHMLAQKYCPGGAGGLVAFVIDGSAAAAEAFAAGLNLIGNRPDARAARSSLTRPDAGDAPAPAAMLLSVGLEDAADIIADLDEALTGT